ncbi:hypothetical protein PSHT_02645 [Puccinia striiformis]|uniref:Uncharacterized protein n=1 Tax=Puccinia striiformis TaxID=27350 RepID=A0A2S4WHE9_9BASI|nr:hypothetical protein PSHT_02645 [Puccinia striiformis]
MQWLSLPTNLAPPTTPSSHIDSSPLLHQSSSGCANELFKRQNTTSKLFTQNMNPPPVAKTFTESVQISGGLTRTQSTWIDGLKIDTLSVTPHVLSIRKKMNPMSTNGSSKGVSGGRLDRTRGRKDRQVELLGIPAPSGEYRLLAQSNRDAQSLKNLNFRNGPDGQFNVLAPIGFLALPALQVGTWQDGSKVIIRSLQATQISITIRNFTMGAIPLDHEAVDVPTQLEQRAIDPLDIVTAGRPLRTNQPYQILAGMVH